MTGQRRGSVPLTALLGAAAPLAALGLALAHGAYGWPAGLALLAAATAALASGLQRLRGGSTGCAAAVAVPLALIVAAGAATLPRDDLAVLSGPTATARVVDVERTTGTRSPSWEYALRLPDGSPVPGGRLEQRRNDLRIGSPVTVRYDPHGTARPRRPGQIDLATDVFWAAVTLLALVLAVVATGLAARPASPLRERLLAVPPAVRSRAARLGALRTTLLWAALSAPWLAATALARHTVGRPLTHALYLLYFLALLTVTTPLYDRPTARHALALLLTGTALLCLAPTL
ncbi:hypothetical protein [Kitasatospora sp. NPDC101183]|uniref:hypothetical protein n=1 Tax=Kitasatospora sp. NPDC101183 TaxID=3364100 RepID=UPI0038044354